MRAVLRFIFLGTFVTIMVLLSIPSAKPITRVQKIRGKLPHRIVSFGDAYSVNSLYQFPLNEGTAGLLHKRDAAYMAGKKHALIGSPPNRANKEMLKVKLESSIEELPEIETPEVWTKRLCDLLACDLHHNFAAASKAGVDNKVYFANQTGTKPSDLQEQLKKWTELENSKSYQEKGETLFTVWFGISDVLKFAELPIDEGVVAVRDSVVSLFNGLSYISEHWSKTRVLVPYAIDISFLPAFHNLLDRTSDPIRATEIQKNAIFLSAAWNQGLEVAGEKWKNGQLMLWNVHDWLASEVRAGNAWDVSMGVGGYGPGKGLSEAQAEQKSDWNKGLKAGWSNVREPCVQKRQGRWSVCEDSEKWLMWDDFRLGAKAHSQLAKNAYQLIKDNWVSGQSVLRKVTIDDKKWLWAGSRGAPRALP